MTEYNKNVYIVVSRYNEDLKWILEYPFTEFKYIVYNKGINDNFEKTNVIQIINLPNVGREGHTYLYHIIENYNDLPNIIVFFPGSITHHVKFDKAKQILLNIIDSNFTKAYFVGEYYDDIYTKHKDFKTNNYLSSDINNRIINKEQKTQLCVIRPFGRWYRYFFGNIKTHWFTHCGVFSVDKRDIIQHPIENYQRIIKTLERSSNPEAGHYIERTWGTIFFPMIYTNKIRQKQFGP
jgi:hypothetical protein